MNTSELHTSKIQLACPFCYSKSLIEPIECAHFMI